jgi:WD40 repeat protein
VRVSPSLAPHGGQARRYISRMLILDAGCPVKVLRFAPDGRLLAGSGYPNGRHQSLREPASIDVWSLPAGTRVRVPLTDASWERPNELAVHPTGNRVWGTFQGTTFLFDLTTGEQFDGDQRLGLNSVALSPDGRRMVGEERGENQILLFGSENDSHTWTLSLGLETVHLAGFLPDGDRFVTVHERVSVRSFAAGGEEVAAAKYPTYNINQPQVSPDGRHLGVIGYSCMYVYDVPAPGKPRRIGGSSAFGDFRSFAFHPAGRALAVIHGGPTLVKLYDLATLTLKHKLNWKLGPLLSVAFSPDGTLAAAGSADGRIVVWDVDE